MAVLMPSLAHCAGRMQSGERRVAERLLQKLEDDYLCWYDVAIGGKQLHPDFVILNPHRGILVLEVKDWNIGTIAEMDRTQGRLHLATGLEQTANPVEQARKYVLKVADMLRNDPQLRNPPSHAYAGKLIMPYGWGVVLTSITRKQFEEHGLHEVMEPGKVICRDEMSESVDPEAFQQRLWNMFTQVFPVKLSLPQIERVRWHMFPELRISTQQGSFGLFDGAGDQASISIPDLVRVMDVQQEQLARSLGDGHRVIHGVAGSGKTMILGFRSLHLARSLNKPILVICYNVTLAARLRQILDERGVRAEVSVRSFHEWCGDLHTVYQVNKPAHGGNYDAWSEALVQSAIDAVDRGQIPRAQYGAVLIDEGHDFQPEWFKLIVQMLDPLTNSLLVLYDDAQSIYGKKRSGKFSFAKVGIQAQGRTTILRMNYRNTAEILSVARLFAEELLNPQDAEDDSIPVIAPESVGRRGPMPELIRCQSSRDESSLIADRIQDEIAQGRSPTDIGVLIRYNRQGDAIGRQLQRRGIPFRAALDSASKRELFCGEPSVKIVTLHSSKGLEFGATFIPRICEVNKAEDAVADDARLLYVGMTRATDQLVMTHIAEPMFAVRVREAIGAVRLACA